MLKEKVDGLRDFPEHTAMMIKHLILSHHGSFEFGSPALPMIREAFVLNFVDDLDAKMNFLDRLSSQVGPDEYQWTDYQRTMERFLYVSGHSAAHEPQGAGLAKDDAAKALDSRQQSLWK